MAGNDTTANRLTADQAGTCEPVTVVRAWATRLDSRAASAGSCPDARSTDRCVVVR